MLDLMLNFFLSGFVYHGVTPVSLVIVVFLALAFEAFWLAGYWPPLFRMVWLWPVLVGVAIHSWICVAFVQLPLQALVGRGLGALWSTEALTRWLLLAGIPQTLLSGLVQEGSKLFSVVVCWFLMGRNISPKTGLVIGAVAGAGLGIFEAS